MTTHKNKNHLEEGASKFLVEQLALKSGSKLLIYQDFGGVQSLVSELRHAASEAGIDVEVLEIEMEQEIGESAKFLKDIVSGGSFDAILELTTKYFYQTDAWSLCRTKGISAYSLAGVDAASFRSCISEVDQHQMRQFGESLAENLSEAKSGTIQSSAGTNISFEMQAPWYYQIFPFSKRKPKSFVGRPSGFIEKSGGSTFMGGQLAFRAIPRSISGTAVIDGYYWPPCEIGEITSDPIILTIARGKVVRVEGCKKKADLVKQWLGSDSKAIKHFCLGFNPGASLAGNILEAERALGVLTIGVGDYPVHTDGIVRRPTLTVDGLCILNDGKYVNLESNDLYEKR